MKCTNCGYENNENSKFCRMCGTQLSAPQAEEYPAYPNPPYSTPSYPKMYMENGNLCIPRWNLTITKRTMMLGGIGLAGLIVLIIVISIIASAASAFKYTLYEQGIAFQYRSTTEDTAVIADGAVLSYFDGSKYDEAWSVLGDSCAVLTSENELYLVTAKEVRLLAEEISWMAISADGSSVACIDQEGVLQMITCADGTTVTLHDSNLLYGENVVISPDGKAVLWNEWDTEDRVEYDLYCYYNGESVKLGSEMYPVAVSEKAERIYAYSSDNAGTYLVSLEGEKEKIMSGVSSMLFNEDFTQSVFIADGKCYYYEEKLDDKVKITSGYYFEPILPINAAVDQQNRYNRLLIDDLTKLPFLIADAFDFYGADIYRLNLRDESEKLASNAREAVLTRDGERIYFLRGDELRSVSAESSMDTMSVASDVDTFYVTDDGKYVYYVNDDDELHAVKNEINDEKIADDVDMLYLLDGNTALFVYDISGATGRGSLYTSKNGGKREKISDEVSSVSVLNGAALYSVYDEDMEYYNLFLLKGGKSSQLLNY